MIVRTAAAVIAFTIGITGVYLWLSSGPSLESFDDVDMAGIPSVGYCEMRNKPEKWSGKIIRMEVDLFWFMHGSFLYDENCAGPADKYLIDNGRTAVSFNTKQGERNIESVEPLFGRRESQGYLRITVVGRFTHERPHGNSDDISDRTAFHFEVFSVDSTELMHAAN